MEKPNTDGWYIVDYKPFGKEDKRAYGIVKVVKEETYFFDSEGLLTYHNRQEDFWNNYAVKYVKVDPPEEDENLFLEGQRLTGKELD